MGEKKRRGEAGWKPRQGQAIEKLYAWVCTEPDGGEGIPAMNAGGMVMPLVGADFARIESLRSHAEQVARESGYPVRLVEFSGRRVVEELDLKRKAN